MIQNKKQAERDAVIFIDHQRRNKEAFMKHISKIERQEIEEQSESSSSAWESFQENYEGDLQMKQPAHLLSGI